MVTINKELNNLNSHTKIEGNMESASAPSEPDDVYSMQAKITTQQSEIKLLKKSGTASAQAIADSMFPSIFV